MKGMASILGLYMPCVLIYMATESLLLKLDLNVYVYDRCVFNGDAGEQKARPTEVGVYPRTSLLRFSVEDQENVVIYFGEAQRYLNG